MYIHICALHNSDSVRCKRCWVGTHRVCDCDLVSHLQDSLHMQGVLRSSVRDEHGGGAECECEREGGIERVSAREVLRG